MALLFPPLFSCRLIYSARFVHITRVKKKRFRHVHSSDENLQFVAAGSTHAYMHLAGGEENVHVHDLAEI